MDKIIEIAEILWAHLADVNSKDDDIKEIVEILIWHVVDTNA